MKKIVLTMMALLTMTMTYAENENTTSMQGVEAYNMSVNMKKLAVALGLNFDQMEAVADIHHNFCNEMMLAAHAEGEEKEALLDNALRKDIRYMRYVLDEKQYKKYLMLLNATLRNRGLK